jgi:hypothetical protein
MRPPQRNGPSPSAECGSHGASMGAAGAAVDQPVGPASSLREAESNTPPVLRRIRALSLAPLTQRLTAFTRHRS